MAKIIRIAAIGDPSVLERVEHNVGAPGAGQVRLIQDAIGINYVDILVRTGSYPVALPMVPGFEAAGTVDAVGPGVTSVEPDDRVAYFFADGAYATQALVSAGALVRLPDDISNQTAATFLAKGLTAWMAMKALHRLSAWDIALVLGASGSVGSILSRWARSIGAEVIGVAGSPDKLARTKAGADHGLLASDPEIAERIRAIAQDGVDVVYDLVGRAMFPIGAQAVRDGGVIATIGATSGPPSSAATAALSRRRVQLRSGGTPQFVRGSTIAVATGELWDAIRAGVFDDLDTIAYRFEDIAAAHADMAQRRLTGLPVLLA